MTELGHVIKEVKSVPAGADLSFFSTSDLAKFGVGEAVRLYLKLQLEAAGLLLVLTLLAIPHIYDNYQRNVVRNECRAALDTAYDAVVADNSTYHRCGFAGLPIRPNIEPVPTNAVDFVLSGPLMWGLGACAEYAAGTNFSLPTPNLAFPANSSLFVATPHAATCDGGRSTRLLTGSQISFGARVCDFVAMVVVIAAMVTLRYRTRLNAIRDDRAMWTTADYTVLLRGLTSLTRRR